MSIRKRKEFQSVIFINTQPSTQDKGLLFLRFGDGGPTVGNSRHKQLELGRPLCNFIKEVGGLST